ncbi:carnitine O-palmitoyltransferase 2, mitochondrial [Anoplophora glabripennis]|uniref:Carnitine O-palmitoyltransferase, mitochondrial n=1 Tax=Anoplophora glabripennis TaxID=217634 RepID=V5G906_ANOGL|nr:carnitine O-palmitoyltransferase 2, mitochondrial [Anoplophora glabripennis]XP_018578915.1 carnitine O-palmitoyltransferase 2, mitochondrial [Anoplophora glabripennis]
MTILRQKVDVLTQQYPPQVMYKLLKKNLISKEYADYQFMQKSKIPTMHFQQSLPRLPIPKLDLTCERYLAAQRPLLIDEAYRKTEYNVNQFKSGPGKQLQDLLKNYDRQNKHTSYISEFWFDTYLRDRKPIPINYNPMLVIHKDERPEYNDQLIRTTNLVISSLRFYKSLKTGLLEPEVFHLNPKKSNTETFRTLCSTLPPSMSWYSAYLFKAYPLDMSQYPNLFNSTRIPEIDKDRLFSNPQGKHITVQYKGHIYAFRVVSDENDIIPAEQILARLKYILEDESPKNEFPIGILTTMERNKWATLRHELGENGNSQTLKLIDSALFNVCLDIEILGDDPYAISRNFLHGDGENRWFDKSFSLQVSKDGHAAVNFEHAWGDGVAVLRYVQDIYKDSRENPFIHPDSKPYDEAINNVIRLDLHLSDKIKGSIVQAKEEYKKMCKSLEIDYLIFDRIGKNVCKKQAVSPDSVMQLGFQVGYYKMTGKFVPTYESCSTAAFKHGRTETVRSCTTATKAFTLAITSKNKPSDTELKNMISDCSRVHNQLTREAAMGQGFDRHLFALKKFADKTNMVCNIFDDPDYAFLNNIILSTSTLNSPAIYAGGFGPVVKDGLGVAYIIKDDQLGVLVTCYPPYQSGSDFIDSLRGTFDELVNLLQKD